MEGIGEWWDAAKRRLVTEADKVRAFVAAVQEFRAERERLPETKAEVEAIALQIETLPASLAVDLRPKLAALQRKVAEVERKADLLSLDIVAMLRKASEKHGQIDQLGRAGYVQPAELGGFFLILGIGAGAVLLTGAIVAWIATAQAVREGASTLGDMVAAVRSGELSAGEARELIAAGVPGIETSIIGGKAAVVLVVALGAAMLWSRRGRR